MFYSNENAGTEQIGRPRKVLKTLEKHQSHLPQQVNPLPQVPAPHPSKK